MRKIGIVTGTRADYSLLENTIKKIHENRELKLQLYVCGMHLLEEYGKTINEIKYPITERIKLGFEKNNTPKDMLCSISKGIIEFTNAFEKNKPEIIVVLGDRIEQFSAAVAAHFLHIPIAHIHGGDVTIGQFDEATRHSITKFSNVHFAVSESSAKRIIKMGEESWRVYNVGAPGLENIVSKKIISKRELFSKYDLDENKKTFLIVYHPSSMEWTKTREQFEEIIKAIDKFDSQKIIIYPNTDAGSYRILESIEKNKNRKNYHIFRSITILDYIGLMKYSDVMIGNSSSGIIEAPLLGLPVVNVGSRQTGREKTKTILDVKHNKEEIRAAIDTALNNKKLIKEIKKCESPYGDGKVSERIVNILEKIEINEELLKKKMTY